MKKILIIQTAFIGDVILATSLVELVKKNCPHSEIHFLLRKGNESLLCYNPHISKVWIWNKKKKYQSLFENVKNLRKINFDYIFNIQRFFNSGLMMALLKGKFKSSFKKNPLSFLAHQKVPHHIPWIKEDYICHEVDRNAQLLPSDWIKKTIRPQLYFKDDLPEKVKKYVVLAPNSVWKTKEWPLEKWKELSSHLINRGIEVHLIGAPSDYKNCEMVRNNNPHIINHCGKMSLHESASLMRRAMRVIANDSAALHLASSVNAPSTGVFCSTTKDFGFYGLSDDAITLEVRNLECKPCGLHGKVQCPQEHFQCGQDIMVNDVLKTVF